MRDSIKSIPLVSQMLRSRAWLSLRHRMVRWTDTREQSHYTHFLRLPTQFEALTGPVVEHVRAGNRTDPLRIVVVGCSTGAEVYTISSVLRQAHPGMAFSILAADIEPRVVEIARKAKYTKEEVFSHDLVTHEFISRTFTEEADGYRVRPEIVSPVEFAVADVFSPDLPSGLGDADIVFAQNFLFHMGKRDALRAFNSITRLLRSPAAFFVDGMDLPVRMEATKAAGLVPLDYKIEEIHNENLRLTGWPWRYWGLEPFSASNADWKRRYGTVFLRG